MSDCPACHQPIVRRKKGACPSCGQALLIWEGQFYREEEGQPPQAIIGEFEKLVARQLTEGQGTPIPFRLNRKDRLFAIELTVAENLIKDCDGNLDLAKRALNELFTNRKWSFKTRTTLRGIRPDFNAALAIARVAAARDQQKDDRDARVADDLNGREDVFA